MTGIAKQFNFSIQSLNYCSVSQMGHVGCFHNMLERLAQILDRKTVKHLSHACYSLIACYKELVAVRTDRMDRKHQSCRYNGRYLSLAKV
jgi:hypothetical protein